MSIMSAVREWLDRLASSVRPRRTDRDLEAELQAHLAFAAEDAERAGESRIAAARRAAVQFGGLTQSMEAARDQRGLRWLTDLVRDTRYGLRALLRTPGFTTVAIATLALGMGANVLIFSVANALLLRPLAIADPASAVRVHTNNFSATPYADYLAFRDRNHSLAPFAAFTIASMSLRAGEGPEHLFGMMVSGNYFETVGVAAARGRTITDSDDRAGAPGVAILSDHFWRRRFGAAQDIVG